MMNIKSKFFYLSSVLVCALTLSGCGKKENRFDTEYLAVKYEKGENWSIINAKGEVVAKEEYAPEDRISEIYNGVYWVKSGDSYSLYNIKDPKKPVTENTWRRVAGFTQGRAAVSNPGEQIKIVDESGDEVAVMPDNVSRVYRFSDDGLAVYKDGATGKYGYIDRSGDIAIKARYDEAKGFNEGLALVCIGSGDKGKRKESEGKVVIINKSGKETGSFSLDKYKPLGLFFSDGLLPVCQKEAETKRIEYVNEKGEVVLTLDKSDVSRYSKDLDHFCFADGYAVFTNKDGKFGIADKKGETVVRPKYDNLFNMGEGRFCAVKNNKWGVIDEKDNTIIDFDYDDVAGLRLGGNYLMVSGNVYKVVTEEDKSAFNDEFYEVSWLASDEYAEYVNVGAMSNSVVKLIDADGFAGLRAGATSAEAAAMVGDGKTAEDYRNSDCIYGDVKVDNSDVVVSARMYTAALRAVNTLSHKERVNSGWWSYDKTVVDGYEYSNAPLAYINVTVSFRLSDVPVDKMAESIATGLKTKGFVEDKELTDDGSKAYKIRSQKCTDPSEENNWVRVIIRPKSSYIELQYRYPVAVCNGNFKGDGNGKSPAAKAESEAADMDRSASAGNTSAGTAASTTAGSGDYAWLSQRAATAADVKGKSKADIRIMRNAIFARHGYKFKDKNLQKHFAQYSWYNPRYDDVTSMLNKIEQQNIAFLKKYE